MSTIYKYPENAQVLQEKNVDTKKREMDGALTRDSNE